MSIQVICPSLAGNGPAPCSNTTIKKLHEFLTTRGLFTVHFCHQTIAAFDLRDGTVHHAPARGFDGYRWRDTHNSTGTTTAIEVQ